MTVSITIRDVPNDTRDVLAARAARSGRSLQEFLSLHLRELAEKPDLDAAVAQIRSRARNYPEMKTSNLLDDIAADRR
ncbi:hypothetical protein BH10ACT7_BH10ACT7_11610 [soil metagenome]